MRRIAIRTENFQLSFRLAKEFKKRKTDFSMIDIDEKWSGIVVTSIDEAEEGDLAVDIDDIELGVERAIQASKGHSSAINLIFGIDPGPRPGVAWLADGMLIGSIQLENIESLGKHIMDLSQIINHQNLIVKVGNGARLIRDRIINELILHGIETQVVSEHNTSSGTRNTAHTKAATRIAIMSGKRVWEIRDIEPNEGEIKEIQNESRILSNGLITISAQLAKLVACGELSLEDAIKKS